MGDTGSDSVPTAAIAQSCSKDAEHQEAAFDVIEKYQWADEDKFVKVYIDGSKEPGAVEAAKDGKSNEVSVDFRPMAFTLMVNGDGRRYVMRMNGLFREILPERCKFRVSA